MTTYWKSLRLGDPGVDSFRSPSEAGQHPHTVPSSEEIQNSQHMFQFREGFRPSPNTPALTTPPLEVGAVKETPTQPLTFFNFVSEHPFLTFGLGALAVYGISKMKEKDPSVNYPPAYPVFTNPTVVLSPGEKQIVKAEECLPGTTVVEVKEKIEIKEKGDPLPEEKKRAPYRRRTTQARDSAGHFLPAGTRRRAVWEGSK